ncbi:MAG: four-helix bundle copper-binding protein [Pseudomonadota bacterium]
MTVTVHARRAGTSPCGILQIDELKRLSRPLKHCASKPLIFQKETHMTDTTGAVVPETAGEEQPIDRAMPVTRRHVLTAMGALAALGGMPWVAGAEETKGHVHGAASGKPGEMFSAAAADCVTVGNACLAHIFRTFKTGETSLAQCGVLVENTIAVCEAAVKLTLNDSAHAKAMVGVCMKECEDCAEECRKHAKQHAICADMAKSCEATVAAARKFIG